MSSDIQSWLAPAVIIGVLLLFIIKSAASKTKKNAGGGCGHGCGCHGPKKPQGE